ncbi:hypothetical protein Taro_027087 [Colocasia esculenta]|uniref:Methyltransferase type 12 domain-containing protein n=1 Tax=Colocasia esculenta TaxID=4460 RepID=A0A843V7T4_COLES|nr:hypothetical protein [Colocasia esculenta]
MALASSPLRQRPSLLVPFRDGLHRVAPCRHRVLSFAAGNELPHLSAGRGRRGGGGNNVDRYANNPGKYWDQFYRRHDNKFFKDRHYLEKDWGRYFYVGNDKDAFGEPKVVLEVGDLMTLGIVLVGCGAGNTLFPLLDAFPEVFVHACDISPHAVSLIKSNGAFRHERVNAFVCDVTLDDLCKKVDQSSVDIITLVMVPFILDK